MKYLDNKEHKRFSKHVINSSTYLFILKKPIPRSPFLPKHTYQNVRIRIYPHIAHDTTQYATQDAIWDASHTIIFIYDEPKEGIYAYLDPPLVIDTDDEYIEIEFENHLKLTKEQKVRLNKIAMYSLDAPQYRTYKNYIIRDVIKIPTHPTVYKYPAYQEELTHLYNFGQALMGYSPH